MRSWPVRILIAAITVLALASATHYMFQRSFIEELIFGVLLFSSILGWRYLDEQAQRRRTSARPRPPNAKEQDAPGDTTTP